MCSTDVVACRGKSVSGGDLVVELEGDIESAMGYKVLFTTTKGSAVETEEPGVANMEGRTITLMEARHMHTTDVM